MLLVKLLLLIFTANGAPILARRVCAGHFAWPIDAGYIFVDGKRVLGDAKTWRGIIVAILATVLMAMVLGLGWYPGVLVACGAMGGDLLSSFIKRRLGMPTSAKAPVLDQVPESLLPALLLIPVFLLSFLEIVVLVILFFGFELVLSKLLYRLGIRQQPY